MPTKIPWRWVGTLLGAGLGWLLGRFVAPRLAVIAFAGLRLSVLKEMSAVVEAARWIDPTILGITGLFVLIFGARGHRLGKPWESIDPDTPWSVASEVSRDSAVALAGGILGALVGLAAATFARALLGGIGDMIAGELGRRLPAGLALSAALAVTLDLVVATLCWGKGEDLLRLGTRHFLKW